MTTRRMEAKAIISAEDRASRVLAQVGRNMKQLDKSSKAMNGLNQAGTALASNALRFLGPAALAYGAKKSLENFASLETAMAKLGVTAEATDEEIAKATQTFRTQGPPLGATGVQMAEAANNFVAAGLSFQQAIEATPQAVRAAKAAGGDINDLAGAGIAAMQQFKFSANELNRAFEIMAEGGKLGRVELKDMARIMPIVGAGAQRLGLAGETGLAKATASLEIIRESVASADEAGTIWQNVVQKTFSNETQKNFKKAGVNLEASIKKGAKGGKDALEVLLDETDKLTKGDPFKIAQLFPDQQAQLGITQLLKQRARLNQMQADILAKSRGVIDNDFARMTKTAEESFKRLGASWDNMVGQMGEALAPLALQLSNSLDSFLRATDRGDNIFQRIRAFNEAYRDMTDPGWRDREKQSEEETAAFYAELWRRVEGYVTGGGSTGAEAAAAGSSAGLDAARSEVMRNYILQRGRWMSRDPRRIGSYNERLGDALSYSAEDVRRMEQGRFNEMRASGALPSNLYPDRNPYSVDVKGEVQGQVEIKQTIEPGSELLRVVDEAKQATAEIKGALRQQNAPGSVGTSSPDVGRPSFKFNSNGPR